MVICDNVGVGGQVITTDAVVGSDVWRKMVQISVDRSFNQITVCSLFFEKKKRKNFTFYIKLFIKESNAGGRGYEYERHGDCFVKRVIIF